MRIIEFEIKPESDGLKIREFLRAFGVSATLLKKLKNEDGAITLNGEPARAIDRIRAGDRLKISISGSGKMPPKRESSDVSLAYGDEDIAVFSKPAGMPVHESRNHRGDTLANAAACFIDGDNAFRALYRLDKDTSGLVVIAKNELAACKTAGKIKKDYYAVCLGELHGSGTIDLPIRRKSESIIERGVFDDGERAVTHWTALKAENGRTLLKINLETGRTHQIRVHFAHIGYPLLGDTLYGEKSGLIARQALHCKTVYFNHPVTGKEIVIDSEFPADFKGLI